MNELPNNNPPSKWKVPQNLNQFFYNPFTNNSSYTESHPPKMSFQSPAFDQKFPNIKNVSNRSNTESSDNVTPRLIFSGHNGNGTFYLVK